MLRCLLRGIHRAITRRRHPMPIGRDRRNPQNSNLLGLRTTANQHVASGVFLVRESRTHPTHAEEWPVRCRPLGQGYVWRPDEVAMDGAQPPELYSLSGQSTVEGDVISRLYFMKVKYLSQLRRISCWAPSAHEARSVTIQISRFAICRAFVRRQRAFLLPYSYD
ncbi:hypothetical protein EVAR_34647_1 [Eumeta japonica]|uniref:Uncharacterized protein n=1 Tax=Eumeta variegata TaxID=151549 RepID=A0A4C1VG66_EUMVA|nr:hypothetical protein EVAR_34647_1 [Eumeta japonica]